MYYPPVSIEKRTPNFHKNFIPRKAACRITIEIVGFHQHKQTGHLTVLQLISTHKSSVNAVITALKLCNVSARVSVEHKSNLISLLKYELHR